MTDRFTDNLVEVRWIHKFGGGAPARAVYEATAELG